VKWSVPYEWVKKFAWLPVVLNAGHMEHRKVAWLEFVWVKYDIRMDREVMSLASMIERKRVETLIQDDQDRFGIDPYRTEYLL